MAETLETAVGPRAFRRRRRGTAAARGGGGGWGSDTRQKSRPPAHHKAQSTGSNCPPVAKKMAAKTWPRNGNSSAEPRVRCVRGPRLREACRGGRKKRQARGRPLACLNGRSRGLNATGSQGTGAGLLLLGGLLGSGLGLGRLLRSSFLGSSHDNDLRILFRDARMPSSRTRNPHATDIRIVVTAG